MRGAVVSSNQKVEIAVAIEVCIRQASADLWLIEISANFRRDIPKDSLAPIQEKLGRLRISHVAANVAYCLIDVPIGDSKVEPAIQVDIQKRAAKPQAVSGGDAHSRLWRDVFETLPAHAVESDHFVVE